MLSSYTFMCCNSVTKSCPTPWDLMMLYNHLILCPPSLFAFNLPQHQDLFQWVGSFASGGQRIVASVLASIHPVNIQGWYPLGLTDLVCLQSKGLSRVFSNITLWKHQFFSAQPPIWSNSHIIHDYWKNHSFDYMDLCWQSNISAFLIHCLGLS